MLNPFRVWWLAAGKPLIHPQMFKTFLPTSGQPQAVFAISGSVWVATILPSGALTTPTQIVGFQFNPNADQLTATRCVQTGTIVSGIRINNIAPRNLLVIQDGFNRAGIWDGFTAKTMNPAKAITVDVNGNTLYTAGFNETRIGLWCAWSGNRLFVFNGRIGRASDIGDPTHFTEEMTLTSFPEFTFPEDVTGAIDRGTSGTTRSQVVVTTRRTVWTLWSGVQNRLPDPQFGQGWAFTNDFQTKIFDAVGCVAGKSLIGHLGLLYWKSIAGLVKFDSTGTVNSSQNLPIIDQEMAYSKRRVAPSVQSGSDLTCAGGYGSYVFFSVPVGPVTNGRCYCTHTQVLDRQTSVVRSTGQTAGSGGWQGIWTGIRPVEWSSVEAGGVEREYCLSMDRDGVPRIWEAFQANRADNGQRIPWLLETRLHPLTESVFDYATFLSFDLALDQIGGNLDVVGSWRGMRGPYHELLTATMTATPGSILTPLPEFTPIVFGTQHENLALQSRSVESRNFAGDGGACQSQSVESKYADGISHAFSLLLRFTGRGALTAYRVVANDQPFISEGIVPDKPSGIDDTGFNLVPVGGCPSHVDNRGNTPTYLAVDAPAQDLLAPFTPSVDDSVDYIAPIT